MARVKVLKENELIGGTDNTSVYPITHTKAIFNSNNKELDQILNEIEEKVEAAETNIASNASLIDTLEISLESTNEVVDTALRILTFASTVENVKVEEQFVANKFNILYDISKNYFVALKNGKYYISFIGHENYNTTSDGVIKARKDRLFWSLDDDFIYRFDGIKLRHFAITDDERAKLLAYPAKPLDIPLATESSQGLMSAEDKRKINKETQPWTNIVWSGHNMNEFTEFGEYYIHGERTNSSDNLPILNAASGHTIEGTLKVYDSSIAGTGKDTDKVVTQILSMSNRIGGDGHIWIRTGQGSIKSNLTWSTWEKLQGIFEKNNVTNLDDLDGYTTNGMYSGIYAGTEPKNFYTVQFLPLDTFLMITINGYAVSKLAVPQITQLLYKLPAKTSTSKQNAEIYLRTGSYNKTDKVWVWGNFFKMATNADLASQVAILTAKINQNAANIASTTTSASEALTAAQDAQTTATTASENAAQAKELATEAKATAEQIQGTAASALTKATEATGKADAAEKAATEAKKATEQHENDKKIHVPTNGEAQQLLMSNGDGTSKWITLDFESLLYYGIEFDTTIANPNCIRIGNLEFHRTLPIQSKIRGCLLNDNGVVIKYLNPDTWEGEVLDGSSGQVMVEIPEFYIKFEEDGTKRRVKMSLVPLYGYKKINKMYVSAYEATVQRSTDKLASVCSIDVDYRGGSNDSSRDGTYRTMLGMPATNISLNDFRTKARNRGSVEWNCNLYRLHKMMWLLFAVEYANFNSQDTFNAALDENGYHQGGLGAGVTTWDGTWNTFNGYYPIVPCGVTNSLGNHTGTVDYNVIGSDGTTVKTFAVPRYRGIENPFGHIWKWTDGCKCIIQSEASGALSKFYVCDDPAKFTASGVGNYDYRGDLPRKEGYVKALILGEDGEIMPLSVGGGSTTYFCDYFYTNIPTSGEAERGVLFSGSASDGAPAGFVCAFTNNAPASALASIGSRLCFIPNK